MTVEKINDFLNCYFEVMGFTDEQVIDWIRNGILNRYEKYKDAYPTISIEDDNYQNYAIKSTNGHYELEDFLLNRLFQSLREIIIRNDENAQSCEYSPKNRTMYISEPAIRKVISSKLNWPDEIKEKFTTIILSTVFDHELGHALKTQFVGGYKVQADNQKIFFEELFNMLKDELGNEKATDFFTQIKTDNVKSSDTLYKDLLEHLSTTKNGMYKSITLTPTELIDSNSSDNGTGICKKTSKERNLTLLDELLQEKESMDNIKLYEIPQAKIYIGSSGNYINNYHLLSGYSPIIGYGQIITSLFGVKGTFQATYLNPDPVFSEFNTSYEDIAEEIFQNNSSPITNINESLNRIMSTKSESDYLQLDLFLAKCYEKKLDKQLIENPEVNAETIINEINSFQTHLTTNDDESANSLLPHNHIFNTLKQRLSSFNNTEHITK